MILLLNYYVSIKRQYDLQTFFEEHDYLKVSSIAKHAGLNPGLVRQYSSGVKHPSAEQAKKIELTIHKLADSFFVCLKLLF
jgi:hypothetical protein